MNKVNGERCPERGSFIRPRVEGVAPKDVVDPSSTGQMNRDGSPIISDHFGQSNDFLKHSENHSFAVDVYQDEQHGKENTDFDNGPRDYDFNDDQGSTDYGSVDNGDVDDDDDDLSSASAQLEELGSQSEPDTKGEQQVTLMPGDGVIGVDEGRASAVGTSGAMEKRAA